ncbi:plexin-C1 isoform X2 [Myripristis murdjan]|uniref:plexin-C1 isoform X2 n=1 Tax=Myripristis murdjan TaxID=586833 RepID=UPI0011762FDB|nr:plexin-C1 isoform X2 [Myripristis murdjan]
MKLLLLAVLLRLGGEPSRCRAQAASHTFDSAIRHFTIVSDSVYVATEQTLYRLSRTLVPLESLTQRGVLESRESPWESPFYRVSETHRQNKTFTVNLLVPFVRNRSLITCGVTDCGYCEVRDLTNISSLLHSENFNVGSLRHHSQSVGFLMDVEQMPSRPDTYLLTATQQDGNRTAEVRCFTQTKAVTMHNTNRNQEGGIFAYTELNSAIKRDGTVEFVDGFQIDSTVYLLSNLAAPRTVRLLWLESREGPRQTLKSLRGATLRLSAGEDGSRLLASAVIPDGPPVLWAGVFGANDSDTRLAVFDISPVQTGPTDQDLDFYSVKKDTSKSEPALLTPRAVLFRRSSMTSVLALRQRSWLVFFIGTGDGLLIKLAVDKAFQSVCPRVLYKANDDRQVFPKMHLDQVDGKHVYVVLGNQMKHLPVSQCQNYTSLQACWAAQDPFCGWCGSAKRCTFEDECSDPVWLSVGDDASQQQMVSHRVARGSSGEITLSVQTHVSVGQPAALTNFACQFSTVTDELCDRTGPAPQFPQCTCVLKSRTLPEEGLDVTVKIRLGSETLTENLKLANCSEISGPATFALCRRCIAAGCGWSSNACSWANAGADSVCHVSESQLDFSKPEISSITPSVLSFLGRNGAVLRGRNLGAVTRVRIQAELDCSAKESPVWNNTGTKLMFRIPSGDKGVVKVCVVLPDGSCLGNATVTYRSLPSCYNITPASTWTSGMRKMKVRGSFLEFVEGIVHDHDPHTVREPTHNGSEVLYYDTPPAENAQGGFSSTMSLKVVNTSVSCPTEITYHPDPHFTSFTSTRTGDDLRVTIQKMADKLNMTKDELRVWGLQGDAQHLCHMETLESSGGTDFFTCEIKDKPNVQIEFLMIKYGGRTVTLEPPSNLSPLMLLALLPIPCIIVAGVVIYRSKQRKLTAQMNRRIEDLELDIRNDIRQGFVDLQTERADLMENVGAIPFLDYKHFASRIFFPEGGALMTSCIRDIGQDVVKVRPDECCQALSKLIREQHFLTCMVHTLEEQKSFTIKDKCAVASLLTVALHSDLCYLTQVMEELLQALLLQAGASQPKLLLRRTESVVEKLLTNWMSVCLYGFLRESVGQQLFLLVSALTQQIAKGPVDSVTEKALYTLSEDWLLWQAQDFTSLKLKVHFAVGSDGEVSDPLEVSALSCDTVEQLKDKILSTFRAKFGFCYSAALRDVRIEYEKSGSFVPLEEVDGSSEVIGDVTMLNTLKHYEVPDGASIKVLSKKTHPPVSPQGSLKDDRDFSVKYFHLIDPDVDEDQRKNPGRKKLKLKEVHLTKLLSTKVAVHSFVENLFRSMWSTPHGKAPHAVKFFFDFLDAQADSMKISDPDVLHIWKTNSLPLRFWVNILKNPQFVFDVEKTPHLDGCLSVIAQAFMDSFSLSDTQLGKHAPTNKLLYAKDIPKFKQEVKSYYRQVREQPAISSSDFRGFLLEESKKHENEFNECAALKELYKFLQRYFPEVQQKLQQNGAPAELKEQLQHVKSLFDGLKSCSWD